MVDRSIVEKVFRLQRRRAIYLLKSFGGFESGNAFLIERLSLVAQLEAIREGAGFQEEYQRRVRFTEALERTRKLEPGKKIQIAAVPDVRDRRLADLPAGIHLKPGELRIEFFGTEDLLRHLFELSQAILNDYQRFQEIVEE
jgi:hypothetical protein